MDKGNGGKLRIFQILGGIVVLLVLGIIGWAIWSSMASPAYTPVTVVVQAQPGGRRGGGAAAAAGTTRPTTQANARGGRRGNGRGRRGAQQTPLDILVAHNPRNPELEAWATAWQASHSTTQPSGDAVTSDADAANLKSLVEKSDLSAIECLHISRLVSNGKDLSAAEAWASPGVARAEKELVDKDHDDNSALPIMDALGQAEDPLWDEPNRRAVSILLERITILLMRFDRSSQWDQRPEWAMIGYGESLYMQGKYDEALAQANKDSEDAKTNPHWTEDQKIGVIWLYAVIRVGQSEWEKAIPYLRQVASVKSDQHSMNAMTDLIMALCRLHQGTEADVVFNEYKERYNPDASSSAAMAGIINDAKYNEQYNKSHTPTAQK